MNVGEICNREVSIIRKDDSLLKAGKLMRDLHVGSLVVIEEKNGASVPISILTDRDILIEVLGEGIHLEKISVRDIMTPQLITAKEKEGVYETIQKMQVQGIRRIPVVNEKGFLVGILALDDVLEIVAEEIKKLADVVYMEREREAMHRP